MKNKDDIDDPDQDCWRRIGIWGNETARCEKLKFVKHCRDCEVFEHAARRSADEYRRKTGEEDLSITELIEKETHAGNQSVMPFRIGDKCFALPSQSIITIFDQVAIHSIPHNRNPVVRGLVAINHEVYTFISIRRLLGLPSRPITSNRKHLQSLFKRTIVVNFGERTVVFYVDEIYQLYRYFERNVIPNDVHMPNEDNKNIDIASQGILVNKENWCDDCHLLNLAFLEQQLKIITQ